MPLENLEEEGLPKNPDLRIAQLRFLLSLPEHRGDAAVRDELMAAVRDNSEPARAPRQRPRPGLAPCSGACGDFPQRGSGPGAPSHGVPETRPGFSHPQDVPFVGGGRVPSGTASFALQGVCTAVGLPL